MRSPFVLLCAVILSNLGTTRAQDTLKAQTFTFDDITKRSGIFQFPTANKNWEKVLMQYKLKCDPRTTQDRFDCGEWDYLSYVVVTDSTGQIDSVREEYPNFKLGFASPDSMWLSDIAIHNFQQYYTRVWISDSIRQSDSIQLYGPNTISSPAPFTEGRSQYVYRAAELAGAGMKPGPITSVSLFTGNMAVAAQNMHLWIGTRDSVHSLDWFSQGNDLILFQGDLKSGADSLLHFQLSEALSWNGKDDIILEFSVEYAISERSGSLKMYGGNRETVGVEAAENGHYLELNGNGFAELNDAENALNALDTAVSILFWAEGAASLPANTSILEAYNGESERVLNIHLPWSNGNIYWDAGFEGSYDRIEKSAPASAYKNQWNHWAFIKNSRTGSMKIYLNGLLWHSGSGKFKGMNGISQLHIGSGIKGNPYPGKLDEFQLWAAELSQADIQSLMRKRPGQGSEPVAQLLVDYTFSNYDSLKPYELVSETDPQIKADLLGSYVVGEHTGRDYNDAIRVVEHKPVLRLYSEDRTGWVDSVVQQYPIPAATYSVSLFEDPEDPRIRTGIRYAYPAGWAYTLNPAGKAIDSVQINVNQTLRRVMRPYYRKFEVVNQVEIGRFITPYGIGLDLGPDGFRWMYDVTDYAQLLDGNVRLSAGNQQELIDLRFDFIAGTPPRDVKKIHHLANMESRTYRSIANDNTFKADTVDLTTEAITRKLITRITGHGHNGESENGKIHCCEWADKQHHLDIDGTRAFQWDIWQDDKCALNPVSDQGGNWAPPRAGWCPGDVVEDVEFELTSLVKSDQMVIDYGIEAVPADNPGQGDGNYVVSMHLIEYGPIHHKLDAAIKDIISPNSWELYRRINPTCAQPKIILQNKGEEVLKGAYLVYGVEGGHQVSFYWQGNLAFMQEEVVDLPYSLWDYTGGEGTFYAEVQLANGKADDYAPNNRVRVPYHQPLVLPGNLEVMYRNNDIEDADLSISNDRGEVVYSKLDAPAKVLNRENISLDPGCYKLEVVTENGFGLSYPLIPQIGAGFLRLRQTDGTLNVSFNPDFGKKLTYYFTVGYILDEPSEAKVAKFFEIYPNPGDGIYTLDNLVLAEMKYHIFDMNGAMIRSGVIPANSGNEIDLSRFAPGVYVLKVQADEHVEIKRLIKH